MALQGPFFGKRDEPTTPRGPGSSPLAGTSALGSAGAAGAQPFAAPSATASPVAPASAATSGTPSTTTENRSIVKSALSRRLVFMMSSWSLF